ncbi:MAG: hypothetical protein QE263_03660 [Vampirovibrionales bacterium]|nr:hypothetical protein [Vampirovibrionales bacterium]
MGSNYGFAADGRVDFFQYDPTQYNPYGSSGTGAGGYDGSGINPYANGTMDAYSDPYGGGYGAMPPAPMSYAPGDAWNEGYDPYGGYSDPYAGGGGVDPYGGSASYAPGNAWSESYDPYAVGGSSAPMDPYYGNNPYGGSHYNAAYGNSYAMNPYGGGCYPPSPQPVINQVINVNVTLPAQNYNCYPTYNSYNNTHSYCMPTYNSMQNTQNNTWNTTYTAQSPAMVPYCPPVTSYSPMLSYGRAY